MLSNANKPINTIDPPDPEPAPPPSPPAADTATVPPQTASASQGDGDWLYWVLIIMAAGGALWFLFGALGKKSKKRPETVCRL